jgi:hypothetical protein
MLDLERLSRELVTRLQTQTNCPKELYAELAACLHEIESDRSKAEDFISEARLVYGDDEITVPTQPIVSIAADGAVWVQAWVWTPPDVDSEGDPA